MKLIKWELITGFFLMVLTMGLTFLHYLIFKDLRTLFFYIMEDLVFLPLQILIATMVIGGLLNLREKQAMLQKLYMVIEVFFSEVGTMLLKHLFEFDPHLAGFRQEFARLNEWTEHDFQRNQQKLKNVTVEIDCQNGDLEQLRNFLMGKRNFMLRLLENPNLLEHETFTELLWAVFHLTEELVHRKSCNELCEADRGHFANDIKRAYVLLIYEWLGYMNHLKKNYPYLFSLAARLNPFDPDATAEIKE
jgi:hypothetical protein